MNGERESVVISKLYIVGPVGSGKTTLAKKLSRHYGLPCCELDGIVYEPNPEAPNGNRKRASADRDAIFCSVLNQDAWIMEDTGRPCFEDGWKRADSILLLEPAARVRKFRILRRWLRQNLQLEHCGYIPDYQMLKCMFRWSDNYDNGTDEVKRRLLPYRSKLSIVKTNRDLDRYVKMHTAR